MFITQDNVPNNYIDESRDFQLLCRLYDLIYNDIRFNINSMENLMDPFKINERFLELLGTRVGFTTTKNIDSELLRYIISAFYLALRNKGSKKGIELAISTILRYEGNKDSKIDHISYDNIKNILNIYLIGSLQNKEALDEFLRYILPMGCIYKITTIDVDPNIRTTSLNIGDTLNPVDTKQRLKTEYSVVAKTENFNSNLTNLPLDYRTTYQATEVIGNENYIKPPQTTDTTKSKKLRRK